MSGFEWVLAVLGCFLMMSSLWFRVKEERAILISKHGYRRPKHYAHYR